MWGKRNSDLYRDKCSHVAVLETSTRSSLNKTVNLRPPPHGPAVSHLSSAVETPAHFCLSLVSSQEQRHRTSLNVLQQILSVIYILSGTSFHCKETRSNETSGKMGGVGQHHSMQVIQTQKNKAHFSHTPIHLMVCMWRL